METTGPAPHPAAGDRPPSPAAAPARPTLLTVLAWIWIVLGAMFTLISLLVAAAVLLVPGPFAPRIPEGAEDALPGMAVIGWMFAHFELLVTFQLLVAAAILIGGICLLKQRAWARTLLEAISWLGIAYLVLWNAFFVYQWLDTTQAVAADADADPMLPFLGFFGVAAALLGMLFYVVPLGALIWMLRHRTVRGALGRGVSSPRSPA